MNLLLCLTEIQTLFPIDLDEKINNSYNNI